MNIAVFIKQVPDTTDVKWTENNNIDRTNMESIINPADKSAVEAALKLKELYGAYVTAISMGPSKAVAVLKEAIALGVDDAFLLCDPKFAGSDTAATSKILAAAVKEKLNNCDLLLFGQSAIDGETGQTGTSCAKRLNLPSVGCVNEILEADESSITVAAETEKEKITYKIQLPCAICINNYIYRPRIPKIDGYIKAHNYEIKTYNIFDLNLNECDTGVKGSPTYVKKIYRNQEGRDCKLYEDTINLKEICDEIKKVI